MSIQIGPIDVLKLNFEIINVLLAKKILSEKEARELIKKSLDENMSEIGKEEFLNSIFTTNHGK